MKKEKPLKDLDRNELIIKWGDIIILNSNHLGHVSRESFMLDWVFSNLPPTPEEVIMVQNDPARKIRDEFLRRLKATHETLDLIGKELESNLTGVKNHLLANEYIEDPNLTERFWRISERGKLMKELGSHDKFIAHRKWELNAVKSQWRINAGLVAVTGLAILIPFFIEWVKSYQTSRTHQEYPAVVVHYDSSQIRSIVEDILKSKDTTKKEVPRKKGKSPKLVSQ